MPVIGSTPNHPEIGRELLYADLEAFHTASKRTIVVLQKHGTNIAITMWLEDTHPKAVFFHSYVSGIILGLLVQPDGTLHDKLDRQIHVFEYLGEI